jgi:hypothetical protein
MDPDANLKEQLELARSIAEQDPQSITEASRLAELVLALNEWITGGGFLPSAWKGEQA